MFDCCRNLRLPFVLRRLRADLRRFSDGRRGFDKLRGKVGDCQRKGIEILLVNLGPLDISFRQLQRSSASTERRMKSCEPPAAPERHVLQLLSKDRHGTMNQDEPRHVPVRDAHTQTCIRTLHDRHGESSSACLQSHTQSNNTALCGECWVDDGWMLGG